MPDELMQRLRVARPESPSGLLEPDPQLLEEILMSEPQSTRRVVTPLRLASVAAVAAALVAVLLVAPGGSSAPVATKPRLDMRAIVESSAGALNSGRAHVFMSTETTKDNDAARRSGSEFVVEFSGDNRSMYGSVDPGDPCLGNDVIEPEIRCGSRPFPIANKVVDGQFYLQDGTRWVKDTNASNMAGSDVFSVDPRNFLAGVAQAAQFEQVGHATVDGVRTRHLRATKLDAIPDFNLGLGPRDTSGLTAFELWVGDDDVVRGLLVSTKESQQSYAGARARLVDGKKVLDQTTLGEPVTVTITSSYKVEFTDLGTDIVITAPADAAPVAGKG